jgi:hypothetical protein
MLSNAKIYYAVFEDIKIFCFSNGMPVFHRE